MFAMIVFWTLIILLSLYIEANTAALVSIWFVPAGIVSLIMAIFKVEVLWQLVAFAALSALFLLISLTVFRKYRKRRSILPNNVDRLKGMNAVVVKRINGAEGTGEVKVDGKYWRAAMVDKSDAEEGEVLKVDHVESTRVFCER